MARVRESYGDRVARLEAEGYSRSQARGHPSKGEPPIVAIRAVGSTGIPASINTFTRGGVEVTTVTVITKTARGKYDVKQYDMTPEARRKLAQQTAELFPDAPEPEESA